MNLVTGGNGLVGSHLIRELLSRGEKVRATRRKSSDISNLSDINHQVEWVEADVLDVPALEKAFEGVTHVYHCAAIVSYVKKDRGRMMENNVQGTANMVNLALDMEVKKFCQVSSIAAIGRSGKEKVITENREWEKNRLTTGYAISKHKSEMEAWRGAAEGLDILVVNPSIVLGKGSYDKGTGRFFRVVDKGLKIYPTGMTGWVGAKDLARIIVELMRSDVKNERFLISAENLRYKEVFDMIAQALNKKPPSIKLTKFLSEMAWRVEKVISPLLGREPRGTKETVRTSMSSFKYDDAKLRAVIDPKYTPMKKVIGEMAKDYLKRK